MSLDKAIEHRKERRKPYYDSRRISNRCRNHGSCDTCYGNRVKYHADKEAANVRDEMEWVFEYDEWMIDLTDYLYKGPMYYTRLL